MHPLFLLLSCGGSSMADLGSEMGESAPTERDYLMADVLTTMRIHQRQGGGATPMEIGTRRQADECSEKKSRREHDDDDWCGGDEA
jgi:hypothetical protein